MGFYAFPDKSYIDMIANTPFKYLMPYGTDGKEEAFLEDYLDYASKKGVRIIFFVKDAYKTSKWYPQIHWCPTDEESRLVECIVKRFGGCEALYGWYLADEPTATVGVRNRDKIERNALSIKKFSSKPIFVEDFPVPKSKLWNYLIGFSDILMTTSYPVPERSLDEAYINVKDLTSKYNKPVIAILQAFGKYQYPYHKRDEITGRPPTIEEIKVMSYLSLLAGAKGILYFSLSDIKKLPDSEIRLNSFKKLAEELKENYSLIASTEKVSEDYGLNKEEEVYAKINHYAGRNYLIAINPTNKSKNIDIFQKSKNFAKKIKLVPMEVKILPLENGQEK